MSMISFQKCGLYVSILNVCNYKPTGLNAEPSSSQGGDWELPRRACLSGGVGEGNSGDSGVI